MNRSNQNTYKEAALDAALAGSENQKVAKVVRALPDDTPSMAWRSALNESIISAAQKRRAKRHWSRIWMPAAGLGTTAAVAASVFLLWVGKPATADDVDVEAAMVSVHRENVHFTDVAGPGLSVTDANPSNPQGKKDVKWEESDLEAL